MSWIVALLVLGGSRATATPLFTTPPMTARSTVAPYQGAFDAAPAFQYRVRLPGGRTNSATHAEWSTPVLVGDRLYVRNAQEAAAFQLSLLKSVEPDAHNEPSSR